MQILSRLLVIVVVLVGLAYSSYAVGRYALSKYLFGPQLTPGSSTGMEAVSRSTKVAESVTRQTDWKGKTPRVELKVLPAEEAGPGPDLPLAAMQDEQGSNDGVYVDRKDEIRTTPSSPPPLPPRHYAGSRNVDNAPLEYSLSGDEYGRSDRRDSNGERPRRRRRRRRKPTTSSATRVTQRAQSSDTNYYDSPESSAPAISERAPAPVISDSGGSSSNVYPDSSSASTRSSTSSGTRATRTRRRRKPARQRHESPVPRPEGGHVLDGGDSPVPLPE
jgi:hypothetical protein